MARVDGKGYKYCVETTLDKVDILSLFTTEGVQPGEVLRLITKGVEGRRGSDLLYEKVGEDNFVASNYHQ